MAPSRRSGFPDPPGASERQMERGALGSRAPIAILLDFERDRGRQGAVEVEVDLVRPDRPQMVMGEVECDRSTSGLELVFGITRFGSVSWTLTAVHTPLS